MTEPAAQSDDCYSRIFFADVATEGEVEGTVGWREGAESRVVFQVWDGPSFAAEGDDLHEAFRKARAGIETRGFLPMVAGVLAEIPTDPHALFEPVALAEIASHMDAGDGADQEAMPKFEPVLWVLVAIIVLVLLLPVLAHAEIRVPGAALCVGQGEQATVLSPGK